MANGLKKSIKSIAKIINKKIYSAKIVAALGDVVTEEIAKLGSGQAITMKLINKHPKAGF